MTFKDAVKQFAEENEPFGDYWSMQFAWSCFTDYLARDRQITERQRCNWDNPCTPETFKRWSNKWYGLRSNYDR